ncbi:Arm DNA-binding domain-containing protein [Burkholderia pseudomallei]|uniref:Arm DNA-binding domain-containing protein n=1 Tax=Burkholderia pseudomallei TaxID=28450 RepID=UPI0009AC9EE6
MHRVAPGLYLRVTETGAAFWMLRYSIAGKAREMSLGRYDDLKLAEAVNSASNARLGLKRDKTDPLAEKRRTTERGRGTTFRSVAADLIEAKKGSMEKCQAYGPVDRHPRNLRLSEDRR